VKKPHFPDPESPERSPYREAVRPKAEPEIHLPRGVLATRPEPPPEPAASKPLHVLTAQERAEHASALLTLDSANNPRFRARILLVPATFLLWRSRLIPHELNAVLHALAGASIVIVLIELRRLFYGTDTWKNR
jgi:hypothetical protein